MEYFKPSFLKFFRDLSANNSSEWFNENRKIYENEVKKPFAVFVHTMIDKIKKHEPGIEIKPAEAIMRINKDIRFSKDKTPYNTHVAANISMMGKKDKSYPGFYFQLSADKISVVGGSYVLEPPQLAKVRDHITKNQKTFKAAYSDKNFKEMFGSIQGEKNKRLTEEQQKVAATEPLIANKQFYYAAELKANKILDKDLPEILMSYYKAGKKVNEFLMDALS